MKNGSQINVSSAATVETHMCIASTQVYECSSIVGGQIAVNKVHERRKGRRIGMHRIGHPGPMETSGRGCW